MIHELKERLDRLELLLNDSTSDTVTEDEFYTIQNEFDKIKLYPLREEEERIAIYIDRKLNRMRSSFGFYDEEAELDMMFPNRHDDDFDDDNYILYDKD